MDVQGWNERYQTSAAVWSGKPNEALIEYAPAATVGPLGRPRALDVGCGEGADAIWLASQGWQVVAVDWAGVALDRARAAALDAGVDVGFVESDVTDPDLLEDLTADGLFDLVTVAYLHPEPEDRAPVYSALPGLVAPGGHLLVIAHDPEHSQLGLPGPHPHRLLSAQDIVAALDLPDDFQVLVKMALPRRRETEVSSVDSVVLARREPEPA